MKEETLGLIALLNLQYWCQDEVEKERLKNIYEKNEIKYQEVLQIKFKSEDIFKKKLDKIYEKNEQAKCLQKVECKEPLFKRMLNRILQIFKVK